MTRSARLVALAGSVGLTLLLALVLAVGWSVTAPPGAAGAARVVAQTTAAPLEVDDAQLRWGVNDESNNRGFAPGTINFLSAGAVPDPGRGGQVIVASNWRGTDVQAWRAESGRVRIEKLLDGSWTRATFAGLSQTTTGATMSGTNGPFSGHQVVIDGGTGVVDRAAGTASIGWTGTFSVVFYSGMTFFTVTDPRLEVTPAGGTVTGVVAGYASSMEDQTQWRPVAGRRVVIADLPPTALSATDGFTVTPRYLGVAHGAATGTAQVTSGASWGSFPTELVSYLEGLGSSSYWYSSGGSADRHKVAAPLTVSYAADRAVTPPVGTTPTGGPSAQTPRTTAQPAPPTRTDSSAAASATASSGASATSDVADPAEAPVVAGTPPSAALTAGAAAVPTPAPRAVYALQSSPASSARVQGSDHRWTWWLGCVLLLTAAATTVQTLHTRRSATSRGPR